MRKQTARALLADKCNENRENLREVLLTAGPGMVIDEVTSGYEALLLSEESMYDAIFLDAELATPDIWRTVKRIRARHLGLEIFLIAAPNQELEVMKAIQFRVRAILHRPLDFTKVKQCVAWFQAP